MVSSCALRFSYFLPWPTPSSLKQSTQLQAQMVVSGSLRRPAAANLLLRSIVNCESSDLSSVLRLFYHLHNPSTFQCNTVMKACSLHQFPEHSVQIFMQMRRKGIQPDSYTFQFFFKSCSLSSLDKLGYAAHGQFIRLFSDSEHLASTSLIHMYLKFQHIDEAMKAFDEIVAKDVLLWTTMVSGLEKAGLLDDARKLFDDMPEKNVISWTVMIKGYSKAGRPAEAMEMFTKMLGEGILSDTVAFLSALSACSQSRDLEAGKWVHQLIQDSKIVLNENLIVTLVDMYAKCGRIDLARFVFDLIGHDTLSAWNAIIDGYCKMGNVDEACSLFNQMESRNLITFNSMITGYIQCSRLKEALSLFADLLTSGLLPDRYTIVGLLSVCAGLGALNKGKILHAYIEVNLTESDIFIGTALLDMYAKCGKMDQSILVFDRMKTKDLMTWTAMISGLAMNGMGKPALEQFSLMKSEGINPNAVVYIGVLNACSHSGLVEEGRRHFKEMLVLYNLEPEIEHYGCMVDLLGRLGLLEEAEKLIRSMKMEPSDVIWASLLRSCRVYKNMDLAERSARELIALEPDKDVGYVQLYNIYIDVGRLNDAAKIRRLMEERGIKKIAAFSSITVNGEVHKFIAGDRSHPEVMEIQETMGEVMTRLKESGYSPVMSQVAVDVDQEEMEQALFGHSERIAIAFGIMRLGKGLPIHIIKNLRVCDDCHLVIKMIAKLWGREIVVRDRSRFHHFSDGRCSCNDFW
ncbi:pentatricopeptide repeat-containing protein At5g66520-like [Phalaenopsis equestris]|uniref:pentatricopeptide repeat-containing protein At5g66520-like n=1 Tax=Phalaenopsis equestris TaxID=78828 RepID=UPI0009E274CE|nr:pentatricopeptide repeat-containing protein At5g66520-like [Phalaenopsis equestris]